MRLVAALTVVLGATAGRAEPFPTRGGESGILDVPDAEVVGAGSVAFAGAMGVRKGRDPADSVTPARLALVAGLGQRVEAGAAMREQGLAGQPGRAAALFGAAVKVALWRPQGRLPGVALDATLDGINLDRAAAARLVASIARMGPLRVSGYVGVFAPGLRERPERGEGIAASLRWGRLELAADLVDDPGERFAGGAIRWMLSPAVGVGAGATWFPRAGAVEGTLGIAVVASPRRPSALAAAEDGAGAAEEPPPPPAPAGAKSFPTDRPRFPVRNRHAPPAGEGTR
jgi:hypothetical protein